MADLRAVLVAFDGGYHEPLASIILGFAAMAAHGTVVAGVILDNRLVAKQRRLR
ncbi:hypothetical protein [Phyllobacterium sp. SB3]|uniref:hypothetical protein n=1 Tax=Phyllobacterium sp. SB3 TaxID=3156073 RepID=UPI0032AF4B06